MSLFILINQASVTVDHVGVIDVLAPQVGMRGLSDTARSTEQDGLSVEMQEATVQDMCPLFSKMPFQCQARDEDGIEPFRAGSISDVFVLLRAFLTNPQAPMQTFSALGITAVGAVTVLAAVLLLNLLDRLVVYGEGRDGSSALIKDGAVVYLATVILLAALLLLSRGIDSSFIYFQF